MQIQMGFDGRLKRFSAYKYRDSIGDLFMGLIFFHLYIFVSPRKVEQ